MLVGYVPDSHTCRKLDIATRRPVVSRDVIYAQDKGIATELQELQQQEIATPKTTKVRFAMNEDVNEEGEQPVLQLQQPVLQLQHQPVLHNQQPQQWQN
jgi:hypothetical protein